MIKSNVFVSANTSTLSMPYLRDISNSVCLPVLYFISYFLSSYYATLVEEFITNHVQKKFYIERIFIHPGRNKLLLAVLGGIIFFVAFLCGYFFYNTAKANGSCMWSYHLNIFERLIYCVFLALTWYHSLSLLGMVLSGGAIVFWCIRENALIYNKCDYNKNISVIKAADIVLCVFSYGLFYILGSIFIIINDRIAAENQINNIFANNIASFLLISGVLILVIMAYIPLEELMRFLKEKKTELIAEYNKKITRCPCNCTMIEKRNELLNQSILTTSFSSRVIIISSVLIPLAGVIFQGIALFRK
jgi:hypothetical protein